jgi:hypothetical protein
MCDSIYITLQNRLIHRNRKLTCVFRDWGKEEGRWLFIQFRVFLLVWWKCLATRQRWWFQNFVDVNAAVFCTSKCLMPNFMTYEFYFNLKKSGPGTVAQTYNPSYWGGSNQEAGSLITSWAKCSRDLISADGWVWCPVIPAMWGSTNRRIEVQPTHKLKTLSPK